MYTTLLHQYQLVQGARQSLLTYCETLSSVDLTKPITSVNNESISSLLLHNADTYTSWLANFGMGEQRPYPGDQGRQDFEFIKQAFAQVDLIVNDFLTRFANNLEGAITATKWGKELTTTPLKLFTHVITHEFHHKGVILNMSRQLGYIPADTDIELFD